MEFASGTVFRHMCPDQADNGEAPHDSKRPVGLIRRAELLRGGEHYGPEGLPNALRGDTYSEHRAAAVAAVAAE